MNTPKHYRVPKEAHPIVTQLYSDIRAVADEQVKLTADYMQDRIALDARYTEPMNKIRDRMIALKHAGAEKLCKAIGIEYDQKNDHAVDPTYLETGEAFFSVLEADEDGPTKIADDMKPPPGLKLN